MKNKNKELMDMEDDIYSRHPNNNQPMFTNGDWVNDGSLIVGGVDKNTYNGDGGIVICEMNPETEYQTCEPKEFIPNCKLVAAAPDMYAALAEFLKEYDDNSVAMHTPIAYNKFITKAKDALNRIS